MTDVIDFNGRRVERDRARCDQRPSDFQLEGWMVDGRVHQVYMDGAELLMRQPAARVRLLTEVLWMLTDNDRQDDAQLQFAITYVLDQDGGHRQVYHQDLATGTNWRHGAWLVRQWWRLTKWWLAIAWRATWGKG